MLLKGKTAVLTGCNRGIGKALLEVFAKNGANVWACVRIVNEDFNKYIANTAAKYNVNIMPVSFDLTNEIQLKEGIKIIKASKQPIDILVNNAGIIFTSLFQMTPVNKMKEVFE